MAVGSAERNRRFAPIRDRTAQVWEQLRLQSNVDLAWSELSRSCHHHPYEIAPTVTEMERLLGRVERVLAMAVR